MKDDTHWAVRYFRHVNQRLTDLETQQGRDTVADLVRNVSATAWSRETTTQVVVADPTLICDDPTGETRCDMAECG